MRYEIVLAPEAVRDLKALRPHVGPAIRDAIELRLRHQPTRTSKSRIKRLCGMSRPQFRFRVDGVRVFHDVPGKTVYVVAVVPKSGAGAWLTETGETA